MITSTTKLTLIVLAGNECTRGGFLGFDCDYEPEHEFFIRASSFASRAVA